MKRWNVVLSRRRTTDVVVEAETEEEAKKKVEEMDLKDQVEEGSFEIVESEVIDLWELKDDSKKEN